MKSIGVLVCGIFLSQALQARMCFSEIDLYTEIVDSRQSNNGEVDEVLFYLKNGKRPIYSEQLLEYTSLDDVLDFVDIDFDGKKEIIIKYDNDYSHSTTRSVVKIDCDRLIAHPLVPELGFYEINNDKKELTTYFKDTSRVGKRKYCFNPSGYLCYKSLAITEHVAFVKEYNSIGETIRKGVVSVEDPSLHLIFHTNRRTNLYKKPQIKSKKYLAKGDKVSILDEQIDDSGWQWYFVHCNGKNLNMWIKAEAVDFMNPQENSVEENSE